MRPREILRLTTQRPWPLPRGPWVMRQIWEALLFAHWPLAPEALAPLLPTALPLAVLDIFEGNAWVGIVPFQMRGVRPRGLPAVPWLSAFPELNVRTYVTLGGRPGVYFFSLDAANPVAVALARRLFSLPYFAAAMRCQRDGDTIAYRSHTRHGVRPALFEARYQPVGPVFSARPGSLAYFLAERYCLYAVGPRGHVYRGEIQHGPWPLQVAEAAIAVNTLADSHGITLPGTPPLLHYAARQEVLVWPPYRVL
jgi:uncharacterized protein YqjF (DUF2071 family)